MNQKRSVRVAAAQLHAGADVAQNLATCLRVIDQAMSVKPDLLVLPEFCNHLSWYDDPAHCYRVSVALDGPFVQALSDKAREHGIHLVVNCTVQREEGIATGTSLLFGPDGRLLGTSDKQVLMGHENDMLRRATTPSPIIETAIGRLALYACMDGVINETPRCLALRGAQILCNSLNSFAPDEASLHVPVRAAENRVFVVAANKVGPLIPEALVEPVSQATSIPVRFLSGAGESQIVAPDGTVLARASATDEAVVWADIHPEEADDKRRPDGTDRFRARRPALYARLAQTPTAIPSSFGAESLAVAVYQPSEQADALAALLDQADALRTSGTQLLVLPELFGFETLQISDPAAALARSQTLIHTLTDFCQATGLELVTSLPLATAHGLRHAAVLIDSTGVVFEQAQLHAVSAHPWVSALGDGVAVVARPWGRLGLIVGDDLIYPEVSRLLALEGADVVAAPIQAREAWEASLGWLERSGENRFCLAVATRPTSFASSLITNLWADFTLMTPWQSRAFDGIISRPLATFASTASDGSSGASSDVTADANAGLTFAQVRPRSAENKVLSHRTHLLDGRPWQLIDALIQPSL